MMKEAVEEFENQNLTLPASAADIGKVMDFVFFFVLLFTKLQLLHYKM